MGRLFVALTLAAAAVLGADETSRLSPRQEARARIVAGYGRLPLRFERNEGQFDPRVLYMARGPGYLEPIT